MTTLSNQQVDSIINRTMVKYGIPGLAISIVRGDSIFYSNGFGVRSIDDGLPVSDETIFHTASISKLFTAQAIINLIREGHLNLHTALEDILPDLNYHDNASRHIQIAQLLRHTSGLRDIKNYHWRKHNQSDSSLSSFIKQIAFKVNDHYVGQYHYSNLGYDLLGYIIERASGKSFDDYMKQHILELNGMTKSDFRLFLTPTEQRSSPHSKRKITGTVYKRKIYPYTREHAPSSTLNASSYELSLWMINFLKRIHTDQDSLFQSMLRPSESTPHTGYGFQLGNINGMETAGHFGGDKGFRSYLLLIPHKKIGLVLLANCDYHEEFRQEILHTIATLL